MSFIKYFCCMKIMKKTGQKLEIIPLGDRALLRHLTEEELGSKTLSGIIIPDTVDREKPEQGIVVAVGEGKYDDNGKLIPMRVRAEDRARGSSAA